MLSLLVGGVMGTGLLLALARPALHLAAFDASDPLAPSFTGAVLTLASPQIDRRIAPHQARCNQPNSLVQVVRPVGAQHSIFRAWFEPVALRASNRSGDCVKNGVFGEPTDLLHFLCGGSAAESINPPPFEKETI